MAYDYDYPESFDHERTCKVCGAELSSKYLTECTECFDENEQIDPDEKLDSREI